MVNLQECPSSYLMFDLTIRIKNYVDIDSNS